MLTVNFDIYDMLINGQMGIVKYFKYYQGKITTVFIKFDDENTGKSLTACIR